MQRGHDMWPPHEGVGTCGDCFCFHFVGDSVPEVQSVWLLGEMAPCGSGLRKADLVPYLALTGRRNPHFLKSIKLGALNWVSPAMSSCPASTDSR